MKKNPISKYECLTAIYWHLTVNLLTVTFVECKKNDCRAGIRELNFIWISVKLISYNKIKQHVNLIKWIAFKLNYIHLKQRVMLWCVLILTWMRCVKITRNMMLHSIQNYVNSNEIGKNGTVPHLPFVVRFRPLTHLRNLIDLAPQCLPWLKQKFFFS